MRPREERYNNAGYRNFSQKTNKLCIHPIYFLSPSSLVASPFFPSPLILRLNACTPPTFANFDDPIAPAGVDPLAASRDEKKFARTSLDSPALGVAFAGVEGKRGFDFESGVPWSAGDISGLPELDSYRHVVSVIVDDEGEDEDELDEMISRLLRWSNSTS